MKEARFIYRCRMCGEVDNSLCCNEENAHLLLIRAFNNGITRDGTGICVIEDTPGMKVKSIDTHRCSDGSTGVTDLIGYKVVETE